jgi:tRNA pseudouridine38-40 synthase
MSSNVVLTVEYQGSKYKGWQRQKASNVVTVQASLERALSFVANHPVTVFCAGRTDAGVHATHQVVHFCSSSNRNKKAWVSGTNTKLPSDIRVVNAYELDATFHARFSASSRSYRYIIANMKVTSAFLYPMVTTVNEKLDAQLMHESAQCLLGEHDFTSFRGSGCQSNSPIRYMSHICVERTGDFIFIDITANAFLLHMVRNIAGMLIAIGKGKYQASKMMSVLHAKDRQSADVTAPPNGLYLVGVSYPAKYQLDSLPEYPPIGFIKG